MGTFILFLWLPASLDTWTRRQTERQTPGHAGQAGSDWEVLVGWSDPSSERPLSQMTPEQSGWSPAWRQKGRGFPAAPRCVTEGRQVPTCSHQGVGVGSWDCGGRVPWMQPLCRHPPFILSIWQREFSISY